MIKETQEISGLHEDASSSTYDSASRQYADAWRGHRNDPSHIIKLRSGMLIWYQKLARQGVEAEAGASIFCGPGFDVMNNDLSPELIDANVKAHPVIVGADWSLDVLHDFHRSMTSQSRELDSKLVLARRDFSGGRSAKMQGLMAGRIEDIRSLDALREFMKWIANEIGADEVERYQAPVSRYTGEVNRGVRQVLQIDQPLDFNPILKGRAETRFIIAHMLLAGTFALTEREFRERLQELQKCNDLDNRELAETLRIWQGLILELNNRVALDFMTQALDANPHAHIIAATDVNVHYDERKELGTYQRLDIQALEASLTARHQKFRISSQWTQNDYDEWPSHTHHVNLVVACNSPSTDASDDQNTSLDLDASSNEGQGVTEHAINGKAAA